MDVFISMPGCTGRLSETMMVSSVFINVLCSGGGGISSHLLREFEVESEIGGDRKGLQR